jgi:hypothetical protein
VREPDYRERERRVSRVLVLMRELLGRMLCEGAGRLAPVEKRAG